MLCDHITADRYNAHLSFETDDTINLYLVGKNVKEWILIKVLFPMSSNLYGRQLQVVEIVACDLGQSYSNFILFPIFIWHLLNPGARISR